MGRNQIGEQENIMNADILKRVGIGGNSALGTVRGDNTGAMMIQQAHAEYAEPSQLGKFMEVSTAIAGVAPGTTLSTTPPMAVWNPPSSGFNLSIVKCSIGYVSGTLGAGSILYAYYTSQTTVPSTGTELTPVNCLLGGPRGVGRAFQGSTLAGTPSILRPMCFTGPMLATSVFQPSAVIDITEGAITVPPGAVFVMQGLMGAGTSPLMLFAVCWEEVAL